MERHVYGERLTARAAVALQSADGLAFGSVHWIEGERLLVEVDASLAPGDPCELRIDASPERGTVLVHGRAVRQLVGGSDEMPRFLIRIVGVVEDDVPTYNAWLDHIRVVGTGPEVSVLSYASGGPSTVSAVRPRALDAHTRSRVEPVAFHASFPTPSRASRASAPSGTAGPSGAPSVSGAGSGGARERLRQALTGFRKTHPVVDVD